MTYVNRVELIGNLGNIPDVRNFSNGNKMVYLSLATSKFWKDKEGKTRQDTQWHRVAVYNPHFVKKAESLQKGDYVRITGALETFEFTKDGQKAYGTEVTVRPYGGDVALLRRAKEREEDEPEEYLPDPGEDQIPF